MGDLGLTVLEATSCEAVAMFVPNQKYGVMIALI